MRAGETRVSQGVWDSRKEQGEGDRTGMEEVYEAEKHHQDVLEHFTTQAKDWCVRVLYTLTRSCLHPKHPEEVGWTYCPHFTDVQVEAHRRSGAHRLSLALGIPPQAV